MKKNLSIVLASVSFLALPFLTLAQFVPPSTNQTVTTVANTSGGPTLATIIYLIIGYLNLAMYLLMAVAVVMFVWNVIQYYVKPNEERKQAGLYVMYSLIGFFVILSLWGLVNILSNTFNLGSTRPTLNSVTNVFPSN